jgi:Ca2+-binding RTX toxin-like protein
MTAALFAPAGLGFENVTIGSNTKVVANDSTNTIDFSGVSVSGSQASDVLTLAANGGNDIVTGSNWTDAITGGQGNDIVDGGTGGNDSLDGGVGFNRLSFAHATTGVNVSLALQGGAQDVGGGRMLTLDNFRYMTGSSHSDTLTGDANANIIDGAGGGDSLAGGGGGDNLTGGGGADSFVFLDTSDSLVGAGNHDVIDFRHGQSDLIDVHAIDADTTTDGNQDFHLVAGGNFSQTAGELIQFKVGGHTIVQGDVNGDGSADFEIQLTTGATLVDGDFVF